MSLFDSFISEEILPPKIAKREVYIAIRSDGVDGDGSKESPYDGSTTQKLHRIFTLKEVQRYTRFYFGPGIFRTVGGPSSANRLGMENLLWSVREGQEFIGSGRNCTILKLELPRSDENTTATVFGSGDPTPEVVISDMTIDCAFADQPNTPGYDYPRIMVQAIYLRSSNIKVRRVRVINFGTRTPYYQYGYVRPTSGGAPVGELNGWECFPIFLIHWALSGQNSEEPDYWDESIEDCIFERPFNQMGRETTCAMIGGGANENTGLRKYHYIPQIRGNMFDGSQRNPGPFPPVPVFSLQFTGTAGATSGRFRTYSQHDLKTGDMVIISGAVEASP